jgi:hypothetical protein
MCSFHKRVDPVELFMKLYIFYIINTRWNGSNMSCWVRSNELNMSFLGLSMSNELTRLLNWTIGPCLGWIVWPIFLNGMCSGWRVKWVDPKPLRITSLTKNALYKTDVDVVSQIIEEEFQSILEILIPFKRSSLPPYFFNLCLTRTYIRCQSRVFSGVAMLCSVV